MPLLEIRHLTKEFTRKKGFFGKATAVRAVDDVSFRSRRGKRSDWSANPAAARRRPVAASCA